MLTGPEATVLPASGHVDDVLARITREVVAAYKASTGRGPVRAKARSFDDSTVVCIVEGIFTPTEATLIASGLTEAVGDGRAALARAMDSRLRELMTAITGRSVKVLTHAVDLGGDGTTCLTWILADEPTH